MSLFGAARLFVVGHVAPPTDGDGDERLAAVRPRAWAAWSSAEGRPEALTRDLGDSCLTWDGRVGRIAAVFDDSGWTFVCETDPRRQTRRGSPVSRD